MTYTAAEVLTFIAAFGVLVGGLGAVVVNIIVALRTGKQLETISVKADVIKEHVNSTASRAAEHIAALQNELRLMREVAAEKKETAAVLAQAAAVTLVTAPALVVPPGETVLAAIETNTAQTAANTATPKAPP